MKTYEETSRAILARRDAYVARQKRRQKQLTSVCAAFCLVTVLGLGVWRIAKPPVTNPATQSTSPTLTVSTTKPVTVSMQSRLYLAMDGKQTLLSTGISLPNTYAIAVQDIRGLSEEEIDAVYLQESEIAEGIVHLNDTDTSHASTMRRENVIIRTVRLGEFQLEIDDPSDVVAISGKSAGEFGRVEFFYDSAAIPKEDYGAYTGDEMTLSGDYYQLLLREEEAGTGRLEINWRPSPALYDALNANPALPLSTFSDVFILCVEYRDGSFEEHFVEIRFSDTGEAQLDYQTEDTHVWAEAE